MNSTLVLLAGGSLILVQFVHQGGWDALKARVFHIDPGAKGNSVLAQDTTGHQNFVVLLGQGLILGILYVVADNDDGAGRVILWFLLAMWLVFLVVSSWGVGALNSAAHTIGLE